MILGGDFNLIRSVEDKSSGVGDKHLINAFNKFIGDFDLKDLYRGAQSSHGLTSKKIQCRAI